MFWLRERVLEGSLMVWDRIALIGRLGISRTLLESALWDVMVGCFDF